MQFVSGRWNPGRGAEFSSRNPATQAILWTGRSANEADVEEAVAAARYALPDWQRLSPEERASFLLAFKSQLELQQVPLAKAISEEVGKPLWDAASEVQAMIGKVAVSLDALRERRSSRTIALPGGSGATRYKPHGVLAVYGPYNFPGHIANGQIIPALAAGNTILFKPSELTPRVAEETVRLWEAAGLPPGVLNLVQGARSTGEALARHPRINGILFTGSLNTGIALRRALVEHPEKILVLELGGNNPLVVHRISDVDAAVYWTIQSAFITAGQRCTCARRLIVTAGNEQFLERLLECTANLQIGAPDDDPQPFFGPLINTEAAERVLAVQQELQAGGASSLLQSRQLDLGPAYLSPGLIDVTDCSKVADAEVFGPLLQVTRVTDLEQAIEQANNTRYGLVSALFTEDQGDFDHFYNRANAGLINWNRPTSGASGQLPFGGVGWSGNHRPAGAFAVDFCNVPIASMIAHSLSLPQNLSPGVPLP